MNSSDLIATARGLAESGPSQANLRRAVSTAYYAVFHCLAGTAADLLIGGSRSEAWHQVYRALEHGSAKTACRNKQAMERFPREVQCFADTFVTLQQARHQADYAFEVEDLYEEQKVLADIDKAENAIVQLEQANILHRRNFAAHVLFKRRSS